MFNAVPLWESCGADRRSMFELGDPSGRRLSNAELRCG